MIYKNDKLNIEIENSEYFEIENCGKYIKLYVDEILKLWVYRDSKLKVYRDLIVEAYNNSRVDAYDTSTAYIYENSIVYAYDTSTAYAYDFTTIYKYSAYAVVKKDNPFVKVFNQVFKVHEDMLVYKKLKDDKIAILRLEKGQVFQSEHHYKCRTNKAFVVAIESIDGKKKYNVGYSCFDESFVYKVGETVSADYDEKINECSKGIHFLLSRKSAERY